MLFVIDVGNTNTVLGVYDGDRLVEDWRIRTERNMTEDEFYVMVVTLFNGAGISPESIRRTIISCVVPPLMSNLDSFCRKYFGHEPRWVNVKTVSDMPILYSNPAEVGADRIVNAVAAYARYRQSCIIIDFGTATTFDAISEKGEYLGGAISPGIFISAEALFQKASKLPRVDLYTEPPSVIGKNTAWSMQSGILFGYSGLVDGIVERMKAEMKSDPKIIATGGLARLMTQISKSIDAVESGLTLEGLRLLDQKAKNSYK